MSSFHKPKLYRTLDGCCICKAKSSSSRFTSSTKYEEYFRKCFHLTQPRHGEICNACVLLVKRFKKLPEKSERHWGHVVDARAGPGVKNFVRERRRESCRERSFKKKHVYKKKINNDSDTEVASPVPSTAVCVPVPDKDKDIKTECDMSDPRVSDFIDLSIWTKKKICCGTIFVGPFGEAIVDPRFIRKCSDHQPKSVNQSKSVPLPKIESPLFTIEKIIESELKTFSDSSTRTSTSSEDDSSQVSVSPIGRHKETRSPIGQSDTDADEGFYDKPSISPTNSID